MLYLDEHVIKKHRCPLGNHIELVVERLLWRDCIKCFPVNGTSCENDFVESFAFPKYVCWSIPYFMTVDFLWKGPF